MNPSRIFVQRPVATTLLVLGLVLSGAIAFFLLPVSPLPQVDFPTISVSASLPGASPETMAATVATPLERALGRIAGVTEITSSSSLGFARVTLQFDLDRDINGAARDVQAAINAARPLLPSAMPSLPTYRKVNPADAPIMILALTAATMTRGQMYDVGSTILAQRLSQVEGVGEVSVSGGALPAVRAQLDPQRLAQNGLGLEDVRQAIVAANTNRPLGALESADRYWQIGSSNQLKTAAEYLPLIVRYQGGAAVRLGDVADVRDSVQDVRNFGESNGRTAVMLVLNRQPGANIIATVDRVRALLPQLRAQMPAAANLDVVMDRTPTIRGSLREVERALLISVALVVMVVFVFLRRARAAAIPSVAVPVSLVGTFGAMYLLGFSLNNLSLMALTVATGFVVDDAIVVLENIVRHVEKGDTPMQAALKGAREIGFTVISISVSLVAVFIPILMMGGIVGRLFREFAFTLTAAILISMAVSLTLTPMMASRLLRARETGARRKTASYLDRLVGSAMRGYRRSLAWALRRRPLVLLMLFATVALNVYLYIAIPKGFFPEQDTGRIMGSVQADQSISFQAMEGKMKHFLAVVRADPAVESVTGFTWGGQANAGRMFISLKPINERGAMNQVIERLRRRLAHEPGAQLFLNPAQDVRVGGRMGNAAYQYTLLADELDTLRAWEPRLRAAFARLPQLADVNTDQQSKGLQTTLVVDRDAVARLGLDMRVVSATLNDAFGQRQVSTIYHPLNQYRVVMELAPQYLQSPETLKSMYFSTAAGAQVPLSAIARVETTGTSLSVNHQGGFPATTISFNLAPGVSLGQAADAIRDAMEREGVPVAIQGGFQGTAKAFQESLASQPWLILAALVTVYIVLGVLYESWIHPVTILSTLPSAGVGALLALMAFDTEFSVIALIGVILLIGIVKKNAIMMIDFAIARQRGRHATPAAAIYLAANLRFRPILMTTLAAMLGAVPLMLGSGDGAELRQPLGISIVGGLLLSQILTLYTTPVMYVTLDRLAAKFRKPHPPSLTTALESA